MHFIVIGRDFRDEKALERRMSVREKHLENADKMVKEGKLIYAGALLNEKGQMAGSVMAVDFESKDALQKEWLDNEVYILGKVWETVEINDAAVAPFVKEKLG